ncbi:EpsG-like putative glucosyltransferase [Chromohalobacter marismortui]|uniref:EpsG-like putative glucosyltransferase n=1 Tax=Chromohalobacter marismortui TaxID=42055 RepID=A0A4R7NVG2_9GAMM|nr:MULTISPECIES: EpsG family protein [Chromohalobacter]MCI0511149.1 EpsG family protein [Chromohalobacter sp.]MCI0594565.1 EpsG family protein [Chromohalobacter sp.]TDU25174.1 EpsG-like putative glucosyltransferase [Chromohalobacter marismortui]
MKLLIPTNGSFGYKVMCLALAGFYAWFLMGLDIDGYIDRANYLIYAKHSDEIFVMYAASSFKTIITNEPIWLLLNIWAARHFTAEDTLRLIIFFSSFWVSFLVLRSYPKYAFLLILFILMPQILKNHIIHLRQGLGISLFFIGWWCRYLPLRIFFIGLAPLVHASFFFIDALFLLNVFFSTYRISTIWRVVYTVGMGVVLGALGMWLAGALGARQGESAEYSAMGSDGSGLAFLFWTLFTVIFCMEGKEFLKNNFFAATILFFYLSTYFLLPVTARVFESGMLLVLLASLGLSDWRRYAVYGLYVFYFCMQWYPVLGLPGYGWASNGTM